MTKKTKSKKEVVAPAPLKRGERVLVRSPRPSGTFYKRQGVVTAAVPKGATKGNKRVAVLLDGKKRHMRFFVGWCKRLAVVSK